MTPLTIAFMGTPDFAVPALEALIGAGHNIVAVYTQPPRPAGRGKHLRKSAVHNVAEASGIDVRTPTNLKSDADHKYFAALDLDVAVVAAYGLILPKPILDAPRFGCINIHASLLPRWRGAAPIQRAILAGDEKTGITIMQMDEGLDTGNMIMREAIAIGSEDTTQSLHNQLADLGATLCVQVMKKLASGSLSSTPQTDGDVTYAAKIDKSEARIDWRKSASEIDRQVRGLSPFPGAWFELNGERVKVLSGNIDQGSGNPGAILDDALLVACGSDAYRVTRAQRAGKGVMEVHDFLRGFEIPKGTNL